MKNKLKLFTFDLSNTSDNKRSEDYDVLLNIVENEASFDSYIRNVFIIDEFKLNDLIYDINAKKDDRFTLCTINNYDNFLLCEELKSGYIILSFDLYDRENRDYDKIDDYIDNNYYSLKITKNVWLIKVINVSIFNLKDLFQKKDKVYFSYVNNNYEAYPTMFDVEIEDFLN